MKNSGWNHRLWSKKMDELQINEDVNTSWSEMQSILDKNMPLHYHGAGNGTGAAVKTIGSKIVSLLGYILPAAAMISAVTYIALKEPKSAKHLDKQNKKELFLEKNIADTISRDKFQKDPILQIDTSLNSKSGSEIKQLENSGSLKKEVNPDSKTSTDLGLQTVSRAQQNISFKQKALFSSNYIRLVIPILPDTILHRKPLVLQQQTISTLSKWNNRTAVYSVAENDISPAKAARQKKNKPVKIKDRKLRPRKIKNQTRLNQASRLTAGAGTGINIYSSGSTFFLEGTLGYIINKKASINTGFRINTARTLQGGYVFQNYKPTDSTVQQLSVADSRKLTIIDIPLNLEYKISNKISLKAGPVISFHFKETATSSKLDTSVYHPNIIYDIQNINAAIENTRTTKVAIGFSAGFDINIRQYSIRADYLQNLKPYKIINDVGSYKNSYSSFQLGIRYNFK